MLDFKFTHDKDSTNLCPKLKHLVQFLDIHFLVDILDNSMLKRQLALCSLHDVFFHREPGHEFVHHHLCNTPSTTVLKSGRVSHKFLLANTMGARKGLHVHMRILGHSIHD